MKIYEEDKNFISNIKDYKYSAIDKSLLSRFILRHYWGFAINFVPRNIAPNIITLCGLFCMMASTILTIFFNPKLNSFDKNWLCLVNAILLFLYSTFDALDGKQAVRTKSSSPLGQLFDHVVDSLVVSMIGITLSSSLKFGLNSNIMLLISFIYLGFYGATIYENITKNMELGYINGPSEGVFLIIGIHLFCYFSDTFSNFLNEKSAVTIVNQNFNNSTIFFLSIIILYLISLVFTLICASGRKFKEYAPNVLIVVEVVFCALATSQLEIFSNLIFAYLIVFTYMFVFSYINAEIIFSRLRNCDIPAFPPFIYLFLLVPGLCIGENVSYFKMCLVVFEFLFAFYSFVTRMYSICWVISDFLNIKVFRIQKVKDN